MLKILSFKFYTQKVATIILNRKIINTFSKFQNKLNFHFYKKQIIIFPHYIIIYTFFGTYFLKT